MRSAQLHLRNNFFLQDFRQLLHQSNFLVIARLDGWLNIVEPLFQVIKHPYEYILFIVEYYENQKCI